MAFTLPRTLPQFIIDSRLYSKGNPQSALPLLFDRSQEIELEGTFSQYFRLYAPVEYHVSALAILTPDVMLTIMESGMECDVEIIGNKLYFYWPRMKPTDESYKAYYRVAGVFLKEVKRKLLSANIYASESQAAKHSSSDPRSGVRLKPGPIAKFRDHYLRLLVLLLIGFVLVMGLSLYTEGLSAFISNFREQLVMHIAWTIVAGLGIGVVVAYIVTIRSIFLQEKGIKLARKLRKDL